MYSYSLRTQYNVPRRKQRQIKKTVLLANLSARDPLKPSGSKAGRFSYTVVTQVELSQIDDDVVVITEPPCKKKRIQQSKYLMENWI